MIHNEQFISGNNAHDLRFAVLCCVVKHFLSFGWYIIRIHKYTSFMANYNIQITIEESICYGLFQIKRVCIGDVYIWV